MKSFLGKHIVKTVAVLSVLFVGILIISTYKKTPPHVEPSPEIFQASVERKTIGKSVRGRDIEAYIFGDGPTRLLFVGGIHGGYEWNSSALAYQFIEYLVATPDVVPKKLSIAIIPSANPDGLYDVIKKEGPFTEKDVPSKELPNGTGRFNANSVDLNRNFDCNWKPKSMWKNKVVSAGARAFSEPEATAIKTFVSEFSPHMGIFWHSKASAVYASECKKGILPMTLDIMNAYSLASGYKAIKSFDAYEISGDAEGWLASINIPAITVELSTHSKTEWDRNLLGFRAILDYAVGI